MQKFIAAVWAGLVLASPVCAQQVLKVAINESTRHYQPALTALYKEVGLVPEFVVLPTERALRSVENGDVDADLGRVVGGTAGYQNVLELGESLSEVSLIAVVKQDPSVSRLTLAELKGRSVASTRGTKMAEATAAKWGIKLTLVNTPQQMYQMLVNDRVEVVLITSVMMPDANVAPLVKVLPPLVTTKAVHVLNQKWAEWAPKLDAALKVMKADGRWAKLIALP